MQNLDARAPVARASLILHLIIVIKALASARGSEKRKKNQKKSEKNPKKIKKIVPVPIYVFVDSEQKAEFKAKIKPCYCSFIYDILEGCKNFK